MTVMEEPGRPPVQVFETEGLPQGTPRSQTARFFMALVRGAERLNLRFARHGNPPVYDIRDFPWVAKIEAAFPAIRAELDQVLRRQDDLPPFQTIAADVRTITDDAHWKSFILCGYGLSSARNVALCPETWRAVSTIPGLKTAMFSIFEPGKHLPPHRGPYNGVLRFHLGLIVPEETDRVAIRVHDQVCTWSEGVGLVFDDAYEHEAWNHSERTRVVLFVDFVKPLRFPASIINWLILNLAVFTPFVREGADAQRAWEEEFYGRS